MKKILSFLTAAAIMSGAAAIVPSAETAIVPFVCTAAEFNGKTQKPDVPVVRSDYSCSTTAVRIKWNKVSGASGYRIYRYNRAAKKWEKIATVKNGNTLEYRDSKLASGTKYKYKVKAYKKVNGETVWGESSKTKNVVTRPEAVKLKAFTAYNLSIQMNWIPVKCDGYQLCQRYPDGTYYIFNNYSCPDASSYVKGSLLPATKYTFRIRTYARDDDGKVVYSPYTYKTKTTIDYSWIDELSTLDKAYVHFMQAKASEKEIEMIRKDICDYAVKKWNNKTKVNYVINNHGYCRNEDVTVTLKYPALIEREPALRTEFRDGYMGVCGDAHMNTKCAVPPYVDGKKDLDLFKEECRNMINRGITSCYEIYCDAEYVTTKYTDDTEYCSMDADNWDFRKYPIGIDVGYSYDTVVTDTYGEYRKVYTLWFLDGEVGMEQDDDLAYGDETLFG